MTAGRHGLGVRVATLLLGLLYAAVIGFAVWVMVRGALDRGQTKRGASRSVAAVVAEDWERTEHGAIAVVPNDDALGRNDRTPAQGALRRGHLLEPFVADDSEAAFHEIRVGRKGAREVHMIRRVCGVGLGVAKLCAFIDDDLANLDARLRGELRLIVAGAGEDKGGGSEHSDRHGVERLAPCRA